MDYKELFVYFITEREDIRILKEAGFDKPWTDDSLLATTRFTNIDREKDKVTRWIREHIKFDIDLIPKIYLSRIFNRIESLELVDWSKPVVNICDDYIGMVDSDRNLPQNNAYMITGAVPRDEGDSKFKIYCKLCKNRCEEMSNLSYIDNCQEMYDALLQLGRVGIASFLAGQIIADVKNTKGSSLYNASDKNTFVCHGPGSMRGLSYYTGKKITPNNFLIEFRDVHEDVLMILDKNNRRDIVLQLLDAQNFQNCLCEFSKYCKLLDNPKAKHRIYD